MRFSADGEEDPRPVPLGAIVLLARSDVASPRLEAISSAKTLVAAARQGIRFNPSDAIEGEAARNFAQVGSIVGSTPSYRLHYPSRYDALPSVAEALKALLQA